MSVRLFAATFATGPAREILAQAERASDARARLIVTANVDHVVLLAENPAFRSAYRNAAIRTLDGMPLVWVARLLNRGEARRITGHDLLAEVLRRPGPPGRRVFLVASTPAVAERVSARFVASGLAPGAVRAVTPPFGFEQDAAYSAELASAVRQHGTTLLVLGVGAPKSEIWVNRHIDELGAPVCLAIGEAVTVAAGMVPRAPALLQRLGLEWLFRFAHAPRRLFRRYFVRPWRLLGILASPRGRRMLAPVKPPRPILFAPPPGLSPADGRARLRLATEGVRTPFLTAARRARAVAAGGRTASGGSSRR